MQYDRYDQLDPLTMKETELRIQFASIRVELKHADSERRRIEQELSELKGRLGKTSWRRTALGGVMSLLISANAILVNVGTGMIFTNPPNSLGYILLGFAAFIYIVGFYVLTFIVGGKMND